MFGPNQCSSTKTKLFSSPVAREEVQSIYSQNFKYQATESYQKGSSTKTKL